MFTLAKISNNKKLRGLISYGILSILGGYITTKSSKKLRSFYTRTFFRIQISKNLKFEIARSKVNGN
jgi:hypothetical protein